MDAFEAADTFTDARWDLVMGINVTVPTRMIRAVLPMMKENKNGAIINVASRAAVSGAAAGVAVTASKHALLGVTKNTAWRFHAEGIRCNAILPGGWCSLTIFCGHGIMTTFSHRYKYWGDYRQTLVRPGQLCPRCVSLKFQVI